MVISVSHLVLREREKEREMGGVGGGIGDNKRVYKTVSYVLAIYFLCLY